MGEYSSPLIADDKIFASTRGDGFFVLSLRDAPKIVANTTIANDTSRFNASPAISGGSIFLRPNDAICRFGKK